VGSAGAICNDGIVPNKARICLTGYCQTGAHCPAAWHCVRYASNDPVGACANGANLMPCNGAADCAAANHCAKGSATDDMGFCTDGKMGSFCGENTDCLSGTCAAGIPGMTGVCL
jgi:hypothetical protein